MTAAQKTAAPDAAAPALKVEMREKIAFVTINRPETRNAINTEIRLELPRVLDLLAREAEARVVVLRGAGGQAFASGGDLRELQTFDAAAAREHYLEFEAALSAIENCPLPTIAMVTGFALGGGCEMAAACDFRIAGSDARFGVPVGRLGHQVDLANARRIVRLVGPAHAKQLLMTDQLLSADEAHRIGLVTTVVALPELEAHTLAFAENLASKAPLSLRTVKRSVAWVLQHPDAPDGEDISQFCAPLFDTADFKEGVAAFFEKRRPRFNGR